MRKATSQRIDARRPARRQLWGAPTVFNRGRARDLVHHIVVHIALSIGVHVVAVVGSTTAAIQGDGQGVPLLRLGVIVSVHLGSLYFFSVLLEVTNISVGPRNPPLLLGLGGDFTQCLGLVRSYWLLAICRILVVFGRGGVRVLQID